MWVGTWFKVTVTGDRQKKSGAGYINVVSWNPASETLFVNLVTKDSDSQLWTSLDLPLHFISGVPLRFLSWFEYAGEYAFVVSITGKDKGDNLRSALFTRAALSFQGHRRSSLRFLF